MSLGTRLRPPSEPGAAGHRDRLLTWTGACLALAAAVLLFTRFGLDDTLRRDEAIYTYAGQQLVHGVPVYVSIFDPKTPLAGMLAGLGAAWAKLFGGNDVHAIRIVFFGFSLAAVGAIYVLGLQLWRSVPAALAAAVTFASFKGFALDALGGPDAKTPGIAFGVIAMALLIRRRWFWGAFAGSLAFLVWQPLVAYVVVAGLGALLLSDAGSRGRQFARAVAGGAIPVGAITLYYAIEGAVPQLVEAALRFPVTGVQRGRETFGERLTQIVKVAHDGYGASHWLLWAGLVLAVALVPLRHRPLGRDPYALAVVGSLALLVAFTLTDFQGYPDLYPMLPYAAVGIGGAVAAVSDWAGARRQVVGGIAVAAAAAWFALSWSWFSVARPRDTQLVAQRAAAATLQRIVDPGETLYALGDPTTLVLTQRRNPSRYIYLGSGVAHWNITHSPGGFAGWTRRISAADPAVVVLGGWDGPLAVRMARWLGTHRRARTVGRWLVYLKPAVLDRATRRGVLLGKATPADGPKGAPPPAA